MNKYEKGKITFKDLKISWNLYTTEKAFNNDEMSETFNVELIDKDKKKIRFDFHNSVIEKQISDLILSVRTIRELKSIISNRFHWGGYDKVKNFKELNKERLKNLLYGILNSISLDVFSETSSFKDFCDAYGYDEEQLKSYEIFKNVVEQKDKLLSLNVNWSDWEYIATEEDFFNDELNKILEVLRK